MISELLEKHPSIGIFASGAGAASGFAATLDLVSTVVAFVSVLIGAGVGYYTLRIQRKKYLDAISGATIPPVERRVLVIEDDAVAGRCIEKSLAVAGFQVTSTKTGGEGLAAVNGTYCCVVMDLILPDIHGLTVLDRLRFRYSELPIVVVSGEGDVKNAVKAIKAGAVDYIVKPVGKSQLVNLVESLWNLGGHRNSYLRMKESILSGEQNK